jgi:hypothetical protein
MPTAFNKSNWTRLVSGEHSVQYMPSATGGITTATIAANSTEVITSTVQFQFKGNGPCDISLPAAFTLASGISLGECVLIAPASGSYSLGNHPRVQYKVVNSTAAAVTPVATDVIVTQF